jgi:hypothetical protein
LQERLRVIAVVAKLHRGHASGCGDRVGKVIDESDILEIQSCDVHRSVALCRCFEYWGDWKRQDFQLPWLD